MRGRIFLIISCIGLVSMSVAQPAAQSVTPRFVDITRRSNSAVRHYPPVFDQKLAHIMPMLAAGAAGGSVGDFNNDGWLDVFVNSARLGTPNSLLKNNGDGTFTDVAAKAGVASLNSDDQVSSMGLFLDYDGDGWEDLLVVRFGQSLLFRNKHDGTFEDVTERSGLGNLRRNALAAIAFDYNGDGWLDIYLASYFQDVNMFQLNRNDVMHDSWETSRNGGSNVFYRNNGDGTFTEATEEAGLTDTGWSMALAHGDLDNDGWQDVYVANDFGPDKVFRNTGKGKFEDITEKAIGVDTKKGMNAELGDIDNDGDLDIFVTNVTEEFLHECNMLWQNNGKARFTDVSQELNVCDTGWAWAGKFFDYDNDGDLDLYVANGFFQGNGKGDYLDVLLPALWDSDENPTDVRRWPPIDGRGIAGKERNVLFTNVEGRTFFRETNSGLEVPLDSRAILTADFNNDGRVDVYVTNQDDFTVLFQNETNSINHWIEIELQGKHPNTLAIGARVYLTAGGKTQMREVNSGNGFGGGSMVRQHFGLGRHGIIDSLSIRWPDGTEQTFKALAADRIVRVSQESKNIVAADYKKRSK
jgi:hypothetical protein